MTREELLGRLESLPNIDIFEVTEQDAVVYDHHTATDIRFHFAEAFTLQNLEMKIHVSPDIPDFLRFDTAALAKYLWKYMDHNAFLTLSGLWFVCSDPEYRAVAQFHDCEEAVTLPEYDAMGCMWFARQVCIVDVGRMLRKLGQVAESITFLRRKLLSLALHELRHLMLDTNPALPIEEYPIELGHEFLVERYAQEVCQDSDITGVFLSTETETKEVNLCI